MISLFLILRSFFINVSIPIFNPLAIATKVSRLGIDCALSILPRKLLLIEHFPANSSIVIFCFFLYLRMFFS